jgi:hypothetical protein
MSTRTFRGRTAEEIETKFLAWQRENAGHLTVVEKHLIQPLPQFVQRTGFGRKQVPADAFSMLVEYETGPKRGRGGRKPTRP